MRVSPVAWYHNSLEDVLKEAERSAKPTHNHSDAIVGAQAIASCVFLARTGNSAQTDHRFSRQIDHQKLIRKLVL
jgi:ADP-ribosylglycohydrolase